MTNGDKYTDSLVFRIVKPFIVLLVLLIPAYFLWPIKHGYLGFLFIIYFVALHLPKRKETKVVSDTYTKRTFYIVSIILLVGLVLNHFNIGIT